MCNSIQNVKSTSINMMTSDIVEFNYKMYREEDMRTLMVITV